MRRGMMLAYTHLLLDISLPEYTNSPSFVLLASNHSLSSDHPPMLPASYTTFAWTWSPLQTKSATARHSNKVSNRLLRRKSSAPSVRPFAMQLWHSISHEQFHSFNFIKQDCTSTVMPGSKKFVCFYVKKKCKWIRFNFLFAWLINENN